MSTPILDFAQRAGRLALRQQGVRSTFVETAVGPVHVYDAKGFGSLPPIVLLHGIGAAATPFAALLAYLRWRFTRVVTLDYPGHGFSPDARVPLDPDNLYAAVAEVLDAKLREPFVLAGNSLGGGLALQHAVVRPDVVKALVLMSPAGARSTDEEWKTLRETFTITDRRSARLFLDRIYHRTPLFARLLAHEIPHSLKRKAIGEILASASNDHTKPPEMLRALTMPILLFWGQSERLLPARHLEYFRENLPPQTQIVRPEGFGHCPHFDNPRVLARTIAEFVRKTEARRAG